jgi:hypothetical protein
MLPTVQPTPKPAIADWNMEVGIGELAPSMGDVGIASEECVRQEQVIPRKKQDLRNRNSLDQRDEPVKEFSVNFAFSHINHSVWRRGDTGSMALLAAQFSKHALNSNH